VAVASGHRHLKSRRCGVGDLSNVLIQVLNGITFAMFLYLIAAGLSIVFGVINIVNFAHGSLYMLGAFFTYSLIHKLNFTGNFFLTLLIGPALVGLVGLVMEFILLRRIYEAPHFLQLLMTYGVVLIIQDLVKYFWGGLGEEFVKSVPPPPFLAKSIDILGHPFPSYYLFTIMCGFALAYLIWWFLERSAIGSLIRAAATEKEMLNALGINVKLLYTLVFGLGAFLGGLGGALAAPVRAAYPGMGVEVIVECFIVVVVGGLGRVQGALVAALIIGQLEVFGIMFLEELSMVFIYLLMAIVLLYKPTGLFGKRVGEY
jgi:branched-subunit amino acid ABC-type transport system permease component